MIELRVIGVYKLKVDGATWVHTQYFETRECAVQWFSDTFKPGKLIDKSLFNHLGRHEPCLFTHYVYSLCEEGELYSHIIRPLEYDYQA